MGFYEDRVSIVNMNRKEIYLFKNRNKEITLDYYNQDEGHKSISICKDSYEDFDLAIEDKKINLLYQATDNYLKLLSIEGSTIEEIDLPKEKLARVYEMKIDINPKIKSIIYLLAKFSQKGVFEIYHQIYKEEKWTKSKIEEIRIDKLLNPIKVLKDEEDLLLFFYNGNQICLKRFDLNLLKWYPTIVLTDSTEKLYIDVIRDGNHIHLVYSQYLDQNLSIKYKKYEYKDDKTYEVIDKTVSNKSNTTHPTLVLEDDKIWVVWKDSLGLKSSFSLDGGEKFSNIYLWKKSKTSKYIRYDYKESEINGYFKLKSSFGTIYPYINFLGFGDLVDTEEIGRQG